MSHLVLPGAVAASRAKLSLATLKAASNGWWEADAGITMNQQSGLVTAWADQSPSGRTLSVGPGDTSPTWSDNQQAKLPGVFFSTDDALSGVATGLVSGNGAREMFAVVKSYSQTNRNFLASYGSPNDKQFWDFERNGYQASFNGMFGVHTWNGGRYTTTTTPANLTELLGVSYPGTTQNNIELRRNDALRVTQDLVPGAGYGSQAINTVLGSYPLYVGRRLAAAGSTYANMMLFGLYMWPRQLTTAERAFFITEIMNKWALSS